MPGIKAIYDTQDEIPEPHRELFEERGGKFHLAKIEGIRTDADVARVSRALEDEKKKHGTIKTTLDTLLAGRTAEDVQALLDKYPELEAAAAGKIDDEKINGIVEGRVKGKLAPVERERDTLKTQLAEAAAKIETFEQAEKRRTIHDSVRAAALKSKVIDTAVDDVLMLAERMFELNEAGEVVTKDGVGVTPGVSADVFLTEMQQKRPHWWPPSNGGGGKGGQGGSFANNPFSAEHWNLTEQGRMHAESPAKAEQMARAAGTTIGGLRPAAKK
jgi:hypothetical protein